MENMQDPENLNMDTGEGTRMNEQYFKLNLSQHSLLFTFSAKNVQMFFNLLSNFVASRLQDDKS